MRFAVPAKIKISTLTIILYSLLAIFIFIFIAEPALKGEINLRVSADSETFEAVARGLKSSDLISISSNLLGPVLILKILGYNYYIIFLFNLFIFLAFLSFIIKQLPVNTKSFLTYLFINPLIFISLFAINKEILSLIVLFFFFKFYKSQKLSYLLYAMITSLFIRWQLTLVFLIFFIFWTVQIFKQNRSFYFFLLFLLISILYPLVNQLFFLLIDRSIWHAALDTQGSGFYLQLNSLQDNFLYIIAFIPKLLMNLFGSVIRFSKLSFQVDFYNGIITWFYSFSFLIVFVIFFLKKKFNVRNDIVFFILLYCIVFTISPIVQPRYYFMVYVMISIILSLKTEADSQLIYESIKK